MGNLLTLEQNHILSIPNFGIEVKLKILEYFVLSSVY